VRAALLGQQPLPPNACLLTFDDGLSDHYQHVFPRLRQRGLPGLFFALARRPEDGLALGHALHYLLLHLGADGLRRALWPLLDTTECQRLEQAEADFAAQGHYLAGDPVELFKLALQHAPTRTLQTALSLLLERHVGPEHALADRHYLSPAQVAEMAAGGMSFGGHSRTHPWLNSLAPAGQSREMAASAAWLREVEAGPWAFAYPYGGFDQHSPACLHDAGFAAGFTTHEQRWHASPFLIGRYDGEYDEPADLLRAGLQRETAAGAPADG
jgi:peptidoglycan/xylan/chitin deacetylase (PgdA/CDA1 family)